MSFGHFLTGSLELIAIALALGFASARLRGRLLPLWSGASARLAEAVLGISLLVVILELVGVVGLYRPGLGARRLRPRRRRDRALPGDRRSPRRAAPRARDRAIRDRDSGRRRPRRRGPLGDADPGEPRHRDVSAQHDLAQRPVRRPLRPGPAGRLASFHRRPSAFGLVLSPELGAPSFGGRALPRHRLPLAPRQHRLDGAVPARGLVLRAPLRRSRRRAPRCRPPARRRDAPAV